MKPRSRWILPTLLVVLASLFPLVAWLNVRGEGYMRSSRPAGAVTPALMARGESLARMHDCAGCHTDRGGAAFAGGKGVSTRFGTVYAPNLTPDPETGIGKWSAGDFWRALHNGRSRDGRLLYHAFPYPDYTRMPREDSDALYAFLRAQPAVPQRNRAHDLRFPYNTQAALAVWRALFFVPGEFEVDAGKSSGRNRGAYRTW